MNINLRKRYPHSRTEDIADAFGNGFGAGYDAGYEAGYRKAFKEWQQECEQLRDALHAILERGEAPAPEVTE